jgi:hypothetical protein
MLLPPIDTYEKFAQLAGGIGSIITALAVLAGAIWAYRRFIAQEERYPAITFSADINFVCRQRGYWIIELISIIENKGKVPHKFQRADFDLFALYPADEVDVNDEFGGQAFFPHEILKGTWLPKRFSAFFIAPGASLKYTFVARVPETATAIMLHSWFDYDDRRGVGHAAEKTVALPRDPAHRT